jgi:hypothetical protein
VSARECECVCTYVSECERESMCENWMVGHRRPNVQNGTHSHTDLHLSERLDVAVVVLFRVHQDGVGPGCLVGLRTLHSFLEAPAGDEGFHASHDLCVCVRVCIVCVY